MEKQIGIIRVTTLSFIWFVVGYFSYIALTKPAFEGDSLAYHIPIAESVLNGTVINPLNSGFGLMFYPGASEVILAILIFLHVPLNFFNVFSWILLIFCLYLLSTKVTKNKVVSYLFIMSISFLPSVLRLIPTQTIDIWVAIFFTWALIILLSKRLSTGMFVQLGIAIGMLIGTKVSGILFAIALLAIFLPTLMSSLSFKRFVLFLIPIVVLGCSWYIRNFAITRNPFYPAHLLFFQGKSNFQIQNSFVLKTLLINPKDIFLFIQSLISEYLLWSLSLVLVLAVSLYSSFKKKQLINKTILILSILGLVNFAIYLMLPSSPINMVSDLRYAYPAFIPLILATWLIFEKLKIVGYITPIVILSSLAVFTQFDYLPKLFFVIIMGEAFFLIVLNRKKISI